MILTVNQLTIAERLDIKHCAIQKPQFIGVIGANGAGKSTFLAALAGLLPIAPHSIRLQQHDLALMTVQQRRQQISYLPQFASVSTPVSVLQVLQQGLVNLTLAEQGRAAIERVCDEFNLVSLLSRSITELSGGEQRRVHVARACLGHATLALFDEPGSGLDIGYQLELMDHLKARSDQGQLVIAALHDLALAAQYCDQLMLLHQGQLVAYGTANEVLSDRHLANTFGIKATWLCNDDGVALLAQRLTINQNS
jgi:ABC-type cobalamin/Fe3+-siderophores transport system ATPase subunit